MPTIPQLPDTVTPGSTDLVAVFEQASAKVVKRAIPSLTPAGAVIAFAGSAAPGGWLICNGASLLRASYAALFAVIGTTYGAADGTHFALPDLRGRAPIGAGTGAGLTARALAAQAGEEAHLLSLAELPSHSHGYQSVTFNASAQSGADYIIGTMNSPTSTDPEGGGAAHNNIPPSLALNFLIKT